MPLLTEANLPRKHRPPVWGLVSAFAVLLLVALFGWSFHQPVELAVNLAYELRGIGFGRVTQDPTDFAPSTSSGGLWSIKLPGGPKTGWYGIAWNWH